MDMKRTAAAKMIGRIAEIVAEYEESEEFDQSSPDALTLLRRLKMELARADVPIPARCPSCGGDPRVDHCLTCAPSFGWVHRDAVKIR